MGDPSEHDPADQVARYRFEEERLRIALALKKWAAAIEPIGTSAIRGQPPAALDTLVGARTGPLDAAITLLAPLGYALVVEESSADLLVFKGQSAIDAGVTAERWCHVVVFDSPAWRARIIFRDWLNLHPYQAAAYGALNAELREASPNDHAARSRGRSAFVESILAEAAKYPALRLAKQ